MTIDSKNLFHDLFLMLTSPDDQSEKQAIIYLVLEHQFGVKRTDVMKGKQIDVSKGILEKIVARLNHHEPVQYVLGEAHFYGRTFFVDSSVLIPRPETEMLVDLIKDSALGSDPLTIVDVGTGSGCIAITLALEIPSAKVIATDISADALKVASKNNTALGASVSFHRHDILTEVLNFGQIDLIVSNPPYIAMSEKASMASNVVHYEPASALFVDDRDPLIFYRSLAKEAANTLKQGGKLIAEINERFGKETAGIFSDAGLAEISIVKDIDRKDRIVVARKL